MCLPGAPPPPRGETRHPKTGNRVAIEVAWQENDPLLQVLRSRMRLTEFGADGAILRQEEEGLELRWTYRQEMRYLLELTGFAIEEEVSDFSGAAPAYGKEQIWVARRG